MPRPTIDLAPFTRMSSFLTGLQAELVPATHLVEQDAVVTDFTAAQLAKMFETNAHSYLLYMYSALLEATLQIQILKNANHTQRTGTPLLETAALMPAPPGARYDTLHVLRALRVWALQGQPDTFMDNNMEWVIGLAPVLVQVSEDVKTLVNTLPPENWTRLGDVSMFLLDFIVSIAQTIEMKRNIRRRASSRIDKRIFRYTHLLRQLNRVAECSSVINVELAALDSAMDAHRLAFAMGGHASCLLYTSPSPRDRG
eukprot:3908518-Rhodomonas_salina.1